ncbi:hypothetical protein B5X24_HaOG206213 [Helicoverpa armigera]|nr:hypothetical protein B5X24_HaOG206213 [Helicoverpa armigera]
MLNFKFLTERARAQADVCDVSAGACRPGADERRVNTIDSQAARIKSQQHSKRVPRCVWSTSEVLLGF